MDLGELGWNTDWESAFAPHRAAGLDPARVVHEDKLAYVVVGPWGDRPAAITGRLRHRFRLDSDLPKVGDWVAVAPVPGENKGLIQEVLPRRTRLLRKVTGRVNEAQVLVTNVDVVFVVQAMDDTFNPRRIERFLVMVHEGGARPVVVLNKLDLCARPDSLVRTVRGLAGDALVLPVCAKTGKGTGLLREQLGPGITAVFVGTSGVGKSSLLNRLMGEKVEPTIEVREWDRKGRHTTAWREIHPLPDGGLIIDTPGMRELQLWTAEDGLDDAFPEIAALGLGCRFRDCTHAAEPDCAVRASLEAGKLPKGRYESFQKLRKELVVVTSARREAERKGGGGRRPIPRFDDPSADGGDDEGNG
jgi:ribosome biogenesis GTPase